MHWMPGHCLSAAASDSEKITVVQLVAVLPEPRSAVRLWQVATDLSPHASSTTQTATKETPKQTSGFLTPCAGKQSGSVR